MKRQIFTIVYWITGLLIGLGAFGHGFRGVKPVRAALAAVPLRQRARDQVAAAVVVHVLTRRCREPT